MAAAAAARDEARVGGHDIRESRDVAFSQISISLHARFLVTSILQLAWSSHMLSRREATLANRSSRACACTHVSLPTKYVASASQISGAEMS